MLTVQLLINALALGAAYALCALGFVLVLKATTAVNFAHGHLVAAGGLVAASLADLLPVPGVILLPLILVLTAVLGLVVSLLAYFPLLREPTMTVFVSTIALGIVIENTGLAVFGPEPRAVPPLIVAGTLTLDGLKLGVQAVAVIVVAASLALGLHILLQRTMLGRRLRAVAEDNVMAALIGINVRRMIALTFMLAAALAGAAGLLLGNTFFANPSDGGGYILKAYIAATIGGWGSIAGAVVGALVIAVFEVLLPAVPLLVPALDSWPMASELFSQTGATVLLYLTLLAILFWRPQGLLGEIAVRRA